VYVDETDKLVFKGQLLMIQKMQIELLKMEKDILMKLVVEKEGPFKEVEK
jgi:hypothetical protein